MSSRQQTANYYPSNSKKSSSKNEKKKVIDILEDRKLQRTIRKLLLAEAKHNFHVPPAAAKAFLKNVDAEPARKSIFAGAHLQLKCLILLEALLKLPLKQTHCYHVTNSRTLLRNCQLIPQGGAGSCVSWNTRIISLYLLYHLLFDLKTVTQEQRKRLQHKPWEIWILMFKCLQKARGMNKFSMEQLRCIKSTVDCTSHARGYGGDGMKRLFQQAVNDHQVQEAWLVALREENEQTFPTGAGAGTGAAAPSGNGHALPTEGAAGGCCRYVGAMCVVCCMLCAAAVGWLLCAGCCVLCAVCCVLLLLLLLLLLMLLLLLPPPSLFGANPFATFPFSHSTSRVASSSSSTSRVASSSSSTSSRPGGR